MEMVPLSAASMEKGRALLCEKDGGSTRRKGELDARRLEMALRRLFLGEPRLWLMGVERAVLGEETDLRVDGAGEAGEAEAETLLVGLAGEAVTMEKRAGFAMASLAVRDFLGGEPCATGSAFSQSSSSKISGSGSRCRLPIEAAALGFSGHTNWEEMGDRAA